ncbi:hypothetical protein [Kosakonia sacchari]|uniref:Uncharacterized protein n=1 Tax=Kosakonia sacchari TaxID=1158459 RepID=A0ABZ0MKT9_9ENTR|nr:hypothetical protein [Kosakonia sacchari]WOZ76092.1 hypothetical protein Q8Y70_15960 [Kosakonia sacchari]
MKRGYRSHGNDPEYGGIAELSDAAAQSFLIRKYDFYFQIRSLMPLSGETAATAILVAINNDSH